MDQKRDETQQPERPERGAEAAGSRMPWREPRLTFVEPKLTKHGKLEEITGFFGSFSP